MNIDNNVTVIGCGRWGSFLAWYSSKLNMDVLIYGRKNSQTFLNLKKDRKNEYVVLNEKVNFSDDLKESLYFSNDIIISVGTQVFKTLLEEIKCTGLYKGKTFYLCMKGIVEDGFKRLSEVFNEVLGDESKCVLWVGPGHAEDFTQGIPNCMLMCSEDIKLAEEKSKKFGSSLIRFYYSNDTIGCEVGAASKNVIGIAAGMLDGINYTSLKGALMARGPREIARLVTAMGGDERTVFGISHLGDYEATLFSAHSHNRRFGETFVKGEKYDKLAEGVFTVRALIGLKEKYNVDMPICTAINEIVHNNGDPKEVMASLFLREQKSEF